MSQLSPPAEEVNSNGNMILHNESTRGIFEVEKRFDL
jgi:hypothetical protein